MKKQIWILNHYATNMFFNESGRHYWFAKNLKKEGYRPTIFCANTSHNNENSLKVSKGSYAKEAKEGIPFVFIKTSRYKGNGFSRVLNMLTFAFRVVFASKKYVKINTKPDIILASSVHPLTLIAGLVIARRYRIKCICEIRDLWPESIIAYGLLKKNSIIANLLYSLEKCIYKKADSLIFTMEGGRDYIVEKKWDINNGGIISLDKVFHITNGIDLKLFDFWEKTYLSNDYDINRLDTYRIIYTGSLRKANESVLLIPDIAKAVAERGYNVLFLIYGEGSLLPVLASQCKDKGIENVVLKGKVSRKEIPYILSKADVNILDLKGSEISRFGGSQNKLFEYLASGKPIISGEENKYSIITRHKCGISKKFYSHNDIAEAIINLLNKSTEFEHIREVAKLYDFEVHTKKLINLIETL